MPRGLPLTSVCSMAVITSSPGNSPSMSTRLRRSSMILSMCSMEAGQMSWQARQVVQAQMTSRPMVSIRLAAGSVKAISPIWLTSRIGDSGLPVVKAGQRSWQRLHRVQASASKMSFQRRSVTLAGAEFLGGLILQVDGGELAGGAEVGKEGSWRWW